MSDEKVFFLDFKLCIEFTGEELPDEEVLLTPIKQFIKKRMKTYQKTSRVVLSNTKLYESGYFENAEVEED